MYIKIENEKYFITKVQIPSQENVVFLFFIYNYKLFSNIYQFYLIKIKFQTFSKLNF